MREKGSNKPANITRRTYTATGIVPSTSEPLPRSTPMAEKLKRLYGQVRPEDTVAVLINAAPDSMSSALALQRLFRDRARKTSIYRTNVIKRADNVAMTKLLDLKRQHIRKLDPAAIPAAIRYSVIIVAVAPYSSRTSTKAATDLGRADRGKRGRSEKDRCRRHRPPRRVHS